MLLPSNLTGVPLSASVICTSLHPDWPSILPSRDKSVRKASSSKVVTSSSLPIATTAMVCTGQDPWRAPGIRLRAAAQRDVSARSRGSPALGPLRLLSEAQEKGRLAQSMQEPDSSVLLLETRIPRPRLLLVLEFTSSGESLLAEGEAVGSGGYLCARNREGFRSSAQRVSREC